MRVKRLNKLNVVEFESLIRQRLALNRSGMWAYYAHPGLDDFHWSRLLAACESNSTRVWACLDGDGPILVFGLGKHPFHTEIFQTAIGRVGPLYLLGSQMDAVQLTLKCICSKAKQLGLSLLSLRIPTSEHLLNYSLSGRGWSHVGTSIKLGVDRERWTQHCVDTEISTTYSTYLTSNGSIRLREAQESDVASLGSLITRAHRHSHFFNDPRLPEDGRRCLFAAWIERSVRGTMDLVLVAQEKETMLGFASCLISRGLQRFIGHEVGVLDFVAVDPSAQGQGIGTRLLGAAFAWLFERVPFVELRTMLDNVTALRLYTGLGAVPVASDHHYHRWLFRLDART